MKYAEPLFTFVALAGLIAFSGCDSNAPKPAPPAPTQSEIPDSRAAATAQLAEHAKGFNDIVAQMPGHGGAEHRKLLVSALGEVSSILKLAIGPVQSPEFTNRLTVIDGAQQTATTPSLPYDRMIAVENDALQAAAKAFGEINRRALYDDDQLPTLITNLSEKSDAAAKVVGPMHDLSAAEAFQSMQLVVNRVADDMQVRFGSGDQTGQPAPMAPMTPAAPAATPATTP
jgi:hypothetical protein